MIQYSFSKTEFPIVTLSGKTVHTDIYTHFKRTCSDYILYFMLSGNMYLKEDGISYHLKENDIFLLEPGKEHVGEKGAACTFLYLHFTFFPHSNNALSESQLSSDTAELLSYSHLSHSNNALSESQLSSDTAGKYFLLPKLCNVVTSDIRLLLEELFLFCHTQKLSSDSLSSSLCQCTMLQILLILSQEYVHSQDISVLSQKKKARHLMPELSGYLQKHFQEPLTSEFLSDHFHYHFDYLNRQYKKQYGITIFQSLNQIRMERAKILLSTGMYTVEEAALQTGFKDVSYFTKVFEKYCSTTPGQYKNSTK